VILLRTRRWTSGFVSIGGDCGACDDDDDDDDSEIRNRGVDNVINSDRRRAAAPVPICRRRTCRPSRLTPDKVLRSIQIDCVPASAVLRGSRNPLQFRLLLLVMVDSCDFNSVSIREAAGGDRRGYAELRCTRSLLTSCNLQDVVHILCNLFHAAILAKYI